MEIIDAQVHIWANSTSERPWPNRHRPHRDVPLGAAELLREMDTAGVSHAVLVPPSWEGDRNDLVVEAARLHPRRFAAMGRIELTSPQARDLLVACKQQYGLLGLRLTFARSEFQAPLVEGRLGWLWSGAEKEGLPLMVNVNPAQLDFVDQAAKRHPQLKLVIDHLAVYEDKKDEEAFSDLDKLLRLARHSNVAVKASSMPAYTTDRYPYKRIHPFLRRVYDAFGPQRLFWGSDLTKLPCSYRDAVTMFTEELSWLTQADKEWIMGRGISEWLGWHPPAVVTGICGLGALANRP